MNARNKTRLLAPPEIDAVAQFFCCCCLIPMETEASGGKYHQPNTRQDNDLTVAVCGVARVLHHDWFFVVRRHRNAITVEAFCKVTKKL